MNFGLRSAGAGWGSLGGGGSLARLPDESLGATATVVGFLVEFVYLAIDSLFVSP